MIRPILVLALILAAAVPGLAEPREAVTNLQLQGTLVEVGYLADIAAPAIPVDFDANFAITIRIDSCVPTNERFKVGATATFAIHSPTFLFMGDPKIGKAYRFSLQQVKSGHRTSFENFAVIRLAPK